MKKLFLFIALVLVGFVTPTNTHFDLAQAQFQTAQLQTAGAGKSPKGGGAAPISTVYNQSPAGGDDGGGDSNATFRVIQLAANLSAPSGTPTTFRVTIVWGSSSSTETGSLQAMYCGQILLTGSAVPSFLHTPTQVKFSGGNTANSTPGGVILSDFVALPETFDNTKDWVCSFFINVGSTAHLSQGVAGPPFVQWLFVAGNDASTQVAVGYTTISSAQTAVFVSKIETQ